MNRVLRDDASHVAIFAEHRRALIDYAAPIVGCPARAEDVVQEAFIRFAAAAADEGRMQSPVSYLYRIVRNLSIDTFRRESRQVPGLLSDAQFAAVPEETPPADRTLAARRRLRQLEDAVAELPDRTREIFILNRLYGQTYQEIADRLGVSLSTVQKHLMQALAYAMQKIDE